MAKKKSTKGKNKEPQPTSTGWWSDLRDVAVDPDFFEKDAAMEIEWVLQANYWATVSGEMFALIGSRLLVDLSKHQKYLDSDDVSRLTRIAKMLEDESF